MTHTVNILEVQGLEASIGGSRILRGIDFTIPEKSVFCLMGRNGVGKTSTLRAIMGLMKTDAGTMKLTGGSLNGLGTDRRARHGLGYVPQGREIFPHMTVEENLHIGEVARGSVAKERLEQVFTLFPILKEFLPRKGGMVSGGQQQQLAIGRALMAEPKLLILDEPTEGIQPNIVQQIGDILVKLNREQGLTILLVEQKLPFARRVARHFTVLDRGRSVASGPMQEL